MALESAIRARLQLAWRTDVDDIRTSLLRSLDFPLRLGVSSATHVHDIAPLIELAPLQLRLRTFLDLDDLVADGHAGEPGELMRRLLRVRSP